jgi:hypothetical protein
MPFTTVIRPLNGASRVGEVYPFRDGSRTFAGVVIAIRKVPKVPSHVHVTIELSDNGTVRLNGASAPEMKGS